MRRTAALLLCLLFCLSFSLSAGETVTYGSASFDSEAEYIDLGDQKVTNLTKFITFLKSFPNLTAVDMFATPVTAADVQKLEKAFPDVRFGWYLKMMRYHFVRTDADAYSALDGTHPRHSEAEFSLLKYCPDLLALDLGHNDIRQGAFLENMPNLRVLILGDNPKLNCLDLISTLQNLEYLELFSCGITDISPLTKLTNLMDLNLSNNSVEDWRPLKEMKWLKRLWISGMCTGKRKKAELTAAEQQELEEALPDTEIVYVGEPTQNGWRFYDDRKGDSPSNRVPHYAVIMKMFHSDPQHYVPFEDSPSLSAPPADGDETGRLVVDGSDIEEEILNEDQQ